MNFLVDINPNMKPIEYNMVLCKLNEEQIMTIKNISNLQYRGEFISIDELSFDIPLYRMEPDGTQVKNERYDAIKGDMLILLNDMKYFYIHYAKEKVDSDGATYKEVQAYSREYELSQKKLVGYSGTSRKIYDYTNSKDENGLEIGFFNHIEKICSWRVGYINANVLAKFRALDFPNSNLLQAFQTVQQTFGCVFQFNTLDKTIDIYEVDQLGTNRGLRISDRNFLQTLEKTIKSDEIKTRLYLCGRDNISIQKLSITGQSYIENYDFYKTTEYMSQDLIDALNNYENYLQTKQGLFDGYLTQLNAKNALMGTKRDEMVALLTELKVIQTNLDVAISSGQPTGTFKSQETTKLAEISTKQTEIDTLQDEIDVIENNINQIAIDTDMTAHFTEAQARELDPFIREETFQDSNYTEDNLDELLAEGKKILNRISQPAIQFSVSVVDFLSVVEAQHEWDKFVLGDKVNLFHKDLNFDYEVRMIGYTHKPDSNDLDLKFSNTNTIDDANLYLRDLLSEFKTTATSVDFSRFKWDKGYNANSLISNYISSNLDLTKQQLIKAEGQKPIFDDRGYWGYKVNPDGSIDDKQLRMTNEVIAMTQDNWNNIEVAISPTLGINATLLNGKISNLATLNANQILMGGDSGLISFDDLGNKPWIPQNATDIGARPDDWVPTWAEIQSKPIILSADDIKTTIITKDWIGTLGLMVGEEIQMGTNATISWSNVTNQPNITQITKDTITTSYVNTLEVTAKSVKSSWVYAGTLTAEQIIATGVKVGTGGIELDSTATISWSNVTDQPNIPKGTYIDANGIYTGIVKASQINSVYGKITTAQIENLVVGTNVTMGSNAKIAWANVTGTETVITSDSIKTVSVTASNLKVKSANIDGTITADTVKSTWVYAGNISASQITTGSISADRISGGTITGIKIDVDTNISIGKNISFLTGGNYINFAANGSVNGSSGGFIRYDTNNNMDFFASKNIAFTPGVNFTVTAPNYGSIALQGYTINIGYDVSSSFTTIKGNCKLPSNIGFFDSDTYASKKTVVTVSTTTTDIPTIRNKLNELINVLKGYNLI